MFPAKAQSKLDLGLSPAKARRRQVRKFLNSEWYFSSSIKIKTLRLCALAGKSPTRSFSSLRVFRGERQFSLSRMSGRIRFQLLFQPACIDGAAAVLGIVDDGLQERHKRVDAGHIKI